MTDASQPDDLERTQALVDQARLEAQMRVAEVDTEEARGAGKTGAEGAAAAGPAGGPTEDEDADPVGHLADADTDADTEGDVK